MLDITKLTDRQQRALNRYASAKRHRQIRESKHVAVALAEVLDSGLTLDQADAFALAEAEFYAQQDPFAEVK